MSPGPHDVLIVGAGAAGVAAALEAADGGADVLVVDAGPAAGGAAATAGGGTFVAGSPLQRRLGIEDTPEAALEDWLRWGGDSVDAEWARRYVEDGTREVYGWLEDHGVRWDAVFRHEGNRVARWHAPRGGGAAIMAALLKAAARARIAFRFGCRVTALVRRGGRVVGVHVDDAAQPELRAPSVLVATGGFCSDAELVDRHGPRGASVLLGGAAGARGDGHRVLDSLGARFEQLDAVWMYPYATPDPRDPTGHRGVVLRGMEGDIWVDAAGRRFHDESLRGGASGAPAVLGQPGARCWAIVDAQVAGGIQVAEPGIGSDRARVAALLARSPHVHCAAGPRELAEKAGIDPAGLAATLDEHNAARRRCTHDEQFGRPLEGLAPLDAPPLSAVELRPLARKCLGGVATDAHCRVLATTGRAIDGLFAAGEVAGMAGGRINGRAGLEGTMLGPSLFSGRVAGRQMAA